MFRSLIQILHEFVIQTDDLLQQLDLSILYLVVRNNSLGSKRGFTGEVPRRSPLSLCRSDLVAKSLQMLPCKNSLLTVAKGCICSSLISPFSKAPQAIFWPWSCCSIVVTKLTTNVQFENRTTQTSEVHESLFVKTQEQRVLKVSTASLQPFRSVFLTKTLH